ncbi:MAG: SufE family protein [Anaerolineales bacterium]
MLKIPLNLQDIIDDFAIASRQEKIEMLIGYAEALPPLPERWQDDRDKMEPVPECMTPVFLTGEQQQDGGIVFYFDVPPQSPTVRGLAAILANGLNGYSPEEIISVPSNFYLQMNLQEALSTQRLNGFPGMLMHMKQVAAQYL